jgi:protein tyrosine phosphatase (PTP) superfamily phosphohydrolase (DUF442 family)
MVETLAQTTTTTAAKPFDWRPTIVIALVVLACVFVWWQWFMTYHLEVVQEGVLYRDGNRGMREFRNAVRKVQPKTVVCLIDDNELADQSKPMFAQEVEFLKDRNIKLERVKVQLGGWPTEDEINQFIDIMSDKNNHPVLLHCAQGVRRTGMMVAAYQEAVLGYTDEQAEAAIEWFGRKPTSATIAEVKKFIRAYDGKSRKLTETFAATGTE